MPMYEIQLTFQFGVSNRNELELIDIQSLVTCIGSRVYKMRHQTIKFQNLSQNHFVLKMNFSANMSFFEASYCAVCF